MKSDSYFNEFQQQMIEQGFTLVGKYTIVAPADVKYHVDCEWARETFLVFHRRGVQFLVVCAYHENKGVFQEQSYRAYWRLHFICSPKSYRDLLKTIPKEEMDAAWRECRYDQTPNFKFVGYNQEPTLLSGFRDIGGCRGPDYMSYKYDTEDSPAERIVEVVCSVYQEMAANLARGRFSDIPLFYFYDSYAFNDGDHSFGSTKAERIFWERFDIPYLKSVAKIRNRHQLS